MGDGRNGLGVLLRGRLFSFALIASVSWAVAASPVGCGLDDTAVTQFGADDGGDASIIVGEGGGPVIDDAGADVHVCKPDTCNNYPSVCRAGLPNGCGVDDLDCTLACPPDQGCIKDSGTCDGPPICHDAGAPGGNCETIINPGNLIEAGCGECANPGYTCTSNTCVCGGTVCGTSCCKGTMPNCAAAANTCCALKTAPTNCGTSCSNAVDNGCGGTMDCSSSCGTGGTACAPNTHTCDLPPSCPNMGQPGGSCGTVTGSDGLSSPCGSCATAGFTCTNNVCQCGSSTSCSSGEVCFNNSCCTPEAKTTTCTGALGGACGTSVPNNCGQPVDCGNCNGSSNYKCESANTPTGCVCGSGVCNSGDACCLGGGGDGHFCHDNFKCF